MKKKKGSEGRDGTKRDVPRGGRGDARDVQYVIGAAREISLLADRAGERRERGTRSSTNPACFCMEMVPSPFNCFVLGLERPIRMAEWGLTWLALASPLTLRVQSLPPSAFAGMRVWTRPCRAEPRHLSITCI